MADSGADEVRHCVASENVYVVIPEHPWWTDHPRWLDGKPLEEGFVYTSDMNDRWLSPDELRSLLA